MSLTNWQRALEQDAQDQEDANHLRLLARIRYAQREPIFPGVTGFVASKMVEYLVVEIPPVSPTSQRLIRWSTNGIYQSDVGYEDVPNLNLWRRVQTPFPAYFVTPPPVPRPAQTVVRPSREPLEDDPLHLTLRMRGLTPDSAFVQTFIPTAPLPRAIQYDDTDENQPPLTVRMRGFTPFDAYAQDAVPLTPTASILIQRNLSIYLEEEDAASYWKMLRNRASIAGSSTPIPTTTTTSYIPLIVMA